jgi:hypothetical protein
MSQEDYYGKSKKENVKIVTQAVVEARLLGLVLVKSMLEESLSGCGVGGIEWRRWEKKMENPHFPFGSAIRSLEESVQLVRPANKKDAPVSLTVTSINNVPETTGVT